MKAVRKAAPGTAPPPAGQQKGGGAGKKTKGARPAGGTSATREIHRTGLHTHLCDSRWEADLVQQLCAGKPPVLVMAGASGASSVHRLRYSAHRACVLHL